MLVTGGAGYLGSIIVRMLSKAGYDIRVLDNLMYGVDTVSELTDRGVEFIRGDVRNEDTITSAIKDVDAVIHLAAIVGDVACSQRDKDTSEINYVATLKLACLVSKSSKTTRFIYPSTCSVYGDIGTALADESSSLHPLSLYTKTKIDGERILDFASDSFIPCVLRLSTIYGLSPRMRFDLLVNEFTVQAFYENQFTIYAGERWRPFIHVTDVARAFQRCLEVPSSIIESQIFNVGSDSENYDLSLIGDIYKKIIPNLNVKQTEKIKDTRTYKVSFKKIRERLGFDTEKNIEYGIREIYESLKNGDFKDYSTDKYYNHQRKSYSW